MRTRLIAVTGVLIAGAVGCKKGGDKERKEPTPTPMPGSAQAPTPAPIPAKTSATTPPLDAPTGSAKTVDNKEPAPAAPTAEAQAQCQRIVDKSSVVIAATFAKHEIVVPEFEQNYRKSSWFLGKCANLTDDQRKCLEDAELPVAAIATCKINPPGAAGEQLRPPSISNEAPMVPATPEESAKLLASIVGTWQHEFVGTTSVWTIASDGKAAIAETKKDGTKTNREYAVTFVNQRQAKIQTTPSSWQTYGFLRIDPRTMLLANNLAYRFTPTPNLKKFVVTTQMEWIAVNDKSCTVITQAGFPVTGTCTWGKAGAAKTLEAKWDSGRVRADGTPITDSVKFQLLAGHLVDQRMIDTATFKKK